MKKLFLMMLLGVSLTSFSQSPGIFFQAVAKDANNNAFPNATIYIQSSILQYSATGTSMFVETHRTTTDAEGVFSITLGHGNKVSGSANTLMDIDWGHGPYYLGLKMSTNGSTWTDMGATPFGAVPYALYAGATATKGRLSIGDSLVLYVTPAQLRSSIGSIRFDTTSLSNRIDKKLNIADTAGMLRGYATSTYVDNAVSNVNTTLTTVNTILNNYNNSTFITTDSIRRALNGKVNLSDSNRVYVTPTQLAAKSFDSTHIYNALRAKADTLSPTFSGVVTVKNEINAKRYTTTVNGVITSSANTVIDLSQGNLFNINLANSITTLTLNNAAPGTYLLKFTQTGGGKSVVWPTAWKWGERYIPQVTGTIGRLDIVTLVYDGSTYFATIVQNF